MEYIVHKRFKGQAICGYVNLPTTTECKNVDGVIMYGDKPICVATSENAHQYFARNDDSNGLERGNLTQRIIRKLSRKDSKHQERWNIVWDDVICQKYRNKMHGDYWLWSHAFYKADIEDLRYITKLIGA